MPQIVLLRHGQSTWNLTNQFAGWVDVDLSSRGIVEAQEAAELIRAEGLVFDRAYTSYLKRASKSLDVVLDRLDQLWIPVEKTWRLNERHYGALQGLGRAEVLGQFGADQYKQWRRSYDGAPPPLDAQSPYHPGQDSRYAQVPPRELPSTESLRDCVARILPFWSVDMAPRILSGERILVVAHGSTLRALLKHLKRISDQDIAEVNIPNAVPLVIDLDFRLEWVADRYLGDQSTLEAKISAVAAGVPTG